MNTISRLLLIVCATLSISILAATPEGSAPYSENLAEQGQSRFAATCGFCHGRDAAGGSKGHDLIRSELVANDINGNLIIEVVRNGRPDTEMVAFNSSLVSDADLKAIVAFIHNQRYLASTLEGGRRSVLPEDVAIGNATAGHTYFQNNCSSCHNPAGDLSGIGSRMQGLQLMMRMLYPGSEGRGASRTPARVELITNSGEQISGSLAYQDEFTLALRDNEGVYRSWLIRDIEFTLDNPTQAHVDQLSLYTDADMHDVLAYLLSLQ